MLIYHVALAGDWDAVDRGGEYRVSTRGKSLDEEGFIHCSLRHQIDQAVRLFYVDAGELKVLTIDSDLLESEVRFETAAEGDEVFPHVYGAIPQSAVVATEAYER